MSYISDFQLACRAGAGQATRAARALSAAGVAVARRSRHETGAELPGKINAKRVICLPACRYVTVPLGLLTMPGPKVKSVSFRAEVLTGRRWS
jgi:hypothetical protein